MDVHCSTCGEPWDVHHLWHDAIFDIGLSEKEAREWGSLPRSHKLSGRYREAFKAAGWRFGETLVNVIRCSCCPESAAPDTERIHLKAALEDILGDDEDGLAVTFEDYGL